jgi:3-oxoacyl-[acyl-carrier protein] reductase
MEAETQYAGKVAFVTGGAMGFGRAFCRALGRRGATVALADVDLETAQRTVAELQAEGIEALYVRCDVADEHQVDAAIAEVSDRCDGIDILINNAGRHLTKYSQPFGTLTRDEIRGLFEVNVMGVINCTLAARQAMKRREGGSVVNIASIASYSTNSPYGVSKLAVRGLTVAFAAELAGDGIRVNAISPGLMATENAMADLDPDLVRRFIDQLQLVKRQGTMDDVVAAMLFLCSSQASFVTGETLRVSGGYPLAIG